MLIIIKVKKDKLNTKKNTQDKTKDGLNKVSFFRVYNGLYRQIEQKYKNIENFEFLIIPSKGFFYRLYFENIVFRKIIKEKKWLLN